mmetsp:Transcript_23230/g.49446  ORF Transcript_23230/g.49446 Transcript_23230/m.49446 type:complete len:628 (+) Transcript_23230:47-1930(+)
MDLGLAHASGSAFHVLPEGHDEVRPQEEDGVKDAGVAKVRPLALVARYGEEAEDIEGDVAPLELVHHQGGPAVPEERDVREPRPVHGDFAVGDQQTHEKQAEGDVAGQESVRGVHRGREGGHEVRQHDSDILRHEENQPEEGQAAVHPDPVVDDDAEEQGNGDRDHELFHDLVEQVADDLVVSVSPLPDKDRALHHEGRHVARGAERWQDDHHEEDRGEDLHGARVTRTAFGLPLPPVQGHDHQHEQDLVPYPGAQVGPVGVIPRRPELHQSSHFLEEGLLRLGHGPPPPAARRRASRLGGLHVLEPPHLFVVLPRQARLLVPVRDFGQARGLSEELDEPLARGIAQVPRRPDRAQELLGLGGSPEEGHSARREQEEVVEQPKAERGWRVNRRGDGPVVVRDVLDELHDLVRRGAVQAGRGLVQVQHRGLADHAQGDSHALRLPARQAFGQRVADDDVLAPQKPKPVHELVDLALLPCGVLARRPLQGRRVQEHLLRGQVRDEGRGLLHVTDVPASKVGRQRVLPVKDPPLDRPLRLPLRQDVQEAAFAGARGAHDRRERPGFKVTRDGGQNPFPWLLAPDAGAPPARLGRPANLVERNPERPRGAGRTRRPSGHHPALLHIHCRHD